MTINTVIFDLGGTLIDYAGPYARWPDLETPGLTAAYQHLNQNGWRLPSLERFKSAGFDLLPVRWQQAAVGDKNLRLVDFLAELLRDAGVTNVPASQLTAAAERYQAAICSQAALIDGAQQVLAQVKATGFKMGLISNTMFTGAAHIADLERYGLKRYFDTMVFSADMNKWKPTAAPFLHVLEVLGAEAGTAVYIGDDPGSDVVGAKRAGIWAIHFQSSQRFASPINVQPDARIDHLTQLLPIISHW